MKRAIATQEEQTGKDIVMKLTRKSIVPYAAVVLALGGLLSGPLPRAASQQTTHNKNVEFGLGKEYDDGVDASVAINSQQRVLETHTSEGFKNGLYYHLGSVQGMTVKWGPSEPYDSGKEPVCALNANGVAVEVHHTNSQFRHGLYYHLGRVEGEKVRWGDSQPYATGEYPFVALNDNGVVVMGYLSNSTLHYRVGQVNEANINWGQDKSFAQVNTRIGIALNKAGRVLESFADGSKLYYRLGTVQGKEVAWGTAHSDINGHQPSVSLTEDGHVTEVHKSESKNQVWQRDGMVSGDSIVWFWNTFFDDGARPCVASNGTVAVQVHNSEYRSKLYYSVSLVADRARWMQEHLAQIGDKKLSELYLPGSHDCGMYSGGPIQSLGRTQDKSLYEQLADGIRYFDLRPKSVSGKLVIAHDVIDGPDLTTVLQDVQKFMNEGHQELVILKFSHFKFTDEKVQVGRKQVNKDYDKLLMYLHFYLNPWLYAKPADQRLASITLNDYIETKGKVVVVCSDQHPLNEPSPNIYVYRDWNSSDPQNGDLRVYDQYADKVIYSLMRDNQFKKFTEYRGSCEKMSTVPCDLFLLSWTLTPLTDVWDGSKPANRELGEGMSQMSLPNAKGYIPNILYVDYEERARVADVCACLNYNPLETTARQEKRMAPRPGRRRRQGIVR